MTSLNVVPDKFRRNVSAAARVFSDYGDFIRGVIEIHI